MDRNHTLDAPNNDELKNIEQIEDHSGASTLYREPGEQFVGDILSAEERQRKKDEQYQAISKDIWKSSIKVGTYIPYPLVSGILLGAILNDIMTGLNTGLFLPILAVAGGFWLLTSYLAYARIFKIFYKFGLRAGPFIALMLVSTLLASQAFYAIVLNHFAGQSLLFNIALISIFVLLYNIIASLLVLLAWGNSRLKPIFKILVSVGVLMISGLLVVAAYLL